MTYSIVARDPDNGQLGVAVQSHYFSVGSVCPWAQPGVGAVATQSFAEVSYGPLGLERMRNGDSAADALAALVANDDDRDRRQVAMVDGSGRVAAHTGGRCIAECGHLTGDGWSVQANMMRGEGVPEAMAKAFSGAGGDLADRMLAAMDAAEAAGGDVRGKQSAALIVVGAEGQPWDTIFDLRVEDNPEPLAELRRLVRARRAYLGDLAAADALGPANPEMKFWQAVALATAGQVDAAKPLFEECYIVDPGWALLLRRLPAVGLFPDDDDLLNGLLP